MHRISLLFLLIGSGAATSSIENAYVKTIVVPKTTTDPKGKVCGLSRRVESVASDVRAIPLGRFPWHANVFMREYDKWTHKCGGSLITKRVVITTSFCVEYRQPDTIRVAFAKFDKEWENDEPYTVRRNVSAVTIPETTVDGSWLSSLSNAWNIALILLSDSVEFNDYVMPVCRPLPSSDYAHFKMGQVVSWNGRNKTLGKKEVAIYECAKKERPKTDQICGESYNSTTSAVGSGDGGSSLTVEVNGKHYLIGFVSLKFPEIIVFTNVTYPEHKRWLDDKMGKFKDGGSW